MNDSMLQYQSGFGNQFASEAVPHTLPVGRNSPQRVAHGLYAELLSGSAFTAPRHANLRSWLYRRQPSVVVGAYEPFAQPWLKTGAKDGVAAPPEPMRWHPTPIPDAPADFIEGLRTIVVNGDADAQTGIAAHLYLVDRSMAQRALVNADGEILLVPQLGRLTITSELGILDVAPGEIALLPRGMAFKVAVDGPSRGYVCENYGAPFRLPELGPIGSNGLANARDFMAPVAAYEATSGGYEIVKKYGGTLWAAKAASTPFNVVAWHGSLAPMKYDTAHFMTIGSISFDHPDPSIFTVLTSPSETPGTANLDFVVFCDRWLVGENTFRPPWYHMNVMSEFMGLIYGVYDAKTGGGFVPGGCSLHNTMLPHGPDRDAFEAASNAELKPHRLTGTLAFMFETRFPQRVTAYAAGIEQLQKDYGYYGHALKRHFDPNRPEPR